MNKYEEKLEISIWLGFSLLLGFAVRGGAGIASCAASLFCLMGFFICQELAKKVAWIVVLVASVSGIMWLDHLETQRNAEESERRRVDADKAAKEHAKKVERVKSGECKLLGPGSQVWQGDGKYPTLHKVDFVVYQCANGDVFKMPIN